MKPVRYHPSVQRDIDEALRFYRREASEKVATSFWEEFTNAVNAIGEYPTRFHYEVSGLRRCNLKRFPYHILFEEMSDRIRVQVVRHNLRNPNFGVGRSWK